MSSHIANQSPYLRAQRHFPEDITELKQEIDKAYVDTALAVNQRTIGAFSTNVSYITGETWYLQPYPRPLQSLRQAYPITVAGSYPHGLDFTKIITFTRIWGVAADGTNFYPLPYVDVAAVGNQISLSVTPMNIVVTAGAGAPPSITSGNIVLEWIS